MNNSRNLKNSTAKTRFKLELVNKQDVIATSASSSGTPTEITIILYLFPTYSPKIPIKSPRAT